jgi:predicted metal-dependent hydrolase
MPRTTPPETSHRIALGDADVAYQLRRSQRRTIGLSIDQRGLRIAAPLRARLGDIESLLRQHAAWVVDKLANWRARPLPEKQPLTDGMAISLLGVPCTLVFSHIGRARWQFAGHSLYLKIAVGADPAPLLEAALRERARSVFSERLAHHAARLAVPTPPLRLSSARTRWGSCNQRGQIALNWRLIHLPLPLLDYVVCHELAHLKEMNHSPRFWSVVERLCPDWKAHRLELRRQGSLLVTGN